jgi:hypothetical protein
MPPIKLSPQRHDGHVLVIRRNHAFLHALAGAEVGQSAKYDAWARVGEGGSEFPCSVFFVADAERTRGHSLAAGAAPPEARSNFVPIQRARPTAYLLSTLNSLRHSRRAVALSLAAILRHRPALTPESQFLGPANWPKTDTVHRQ